MLNSGWGGWVDLKEIIPVTFHLMLNLNDLSVEVQAIVVVFFNVVGCCPVLNSVSQSPIN